MLSEGSNVKDYPLILGHLSDEIIIFGRESGLYILSKASILLGDATFKITSKNESQMLILHGIVNKRCYACLFIVMQHKSEDMYSKVYRMVQHLGHLRGLNIFDRKVVYKGDFELSNINAISKLFKKLVFSGCFFHFAYNIMKKVRENSLSKYYKSNNVFYIFVRRIRSLCLIPKDFINNTTLDVIFSPCESVFRTEHHTEYTSFKNYLMKEWLGTNSIHPIKEWNVSNIDIRTNNYCESLHRLINDFITSKVDVVGQIEIIEEIIKKDKKKTNSTPLFCGKKITNYINYIIKFLLKKLRNNKLDFLTYLDLVADAVQIQNLKEYEDFKSTHLMKRNFNNYAKSSILRFQKNGEYQ